MKIGFPLSTSENNFRICDFFKSESLGICDVENGKFEFISTGTLHESSPADSLAGILAEKGVEALVSSKLSVMALWYFKSKNIEVFKANSDNIQETIRMYSDNLLEKMTIKDVIPTNRCNSSCSGSCSTC